MGIQDDKKIEADSKPELGELNLSSLSKQLFACFDQNLDGYLTYQSILDELLLRGLKENDPRLKEFFQYLRQLDKKISPELFEMALKKSGVLIQKAMSGKLIIPEFHWMIDKVIEIHDQVKKNDKGKVANYIPQLAKVSNQLFGVSICTIDGQQYSVGDADTSFSLQSVTKPVNYLLALEKWGADEVHRHLGREPSGHSFNEITLDAERRPHNPMINAGALVCTSLLALEKDPAERFDYVLDTWSRMTGGYRPTYNNAVYLSERSTADRNFALSYFLKENGAFPSGIDVVENLEFYLQCCAIELTTRQLAMAAATLAKSGMCPFTGEQVFKADHVKHCLSMMYSCGMYDFSGEFAFSIGLPAKSGVGGGLMIVIPGVMGCATFSPALDEHGNSVRGVEFSRNLVQTYTFHMYDGVVNSTSEKIDPRARRIDESKELVNSLFWSVRQGDITEVQQMLASETIDINCRDYDDRTPLHVAASNGFEMLVKFLLSQGANPRLKDSWGNTAADEAKRKGHMGLLTILKPPAQSQSKK